MHRLGQLVGRWRANRSCQTRSVMNGVSGAISRVTTYRHSCRVASAAGSPSQKRRRERRTYQLDRSSTYAASRRPGALGVEALQRLGDRRGEPVRLARAPSGRAPAGRPARVPGRPGVQSGRARRRAPGTRRCSSRSAAPCGRSPGWWRARPGAPPTASRRAAMNQRTASAPCSSISGIGSRMLPRCLDILRPSSARMWPRQSDVLVRRLVEDQRADAISV